MKLKPRLPGIIGMRIMTTIFVAYFMLCIIMFSGCSSSRNTAKEEYELAEREMTEYKRADRGTAATTARHESKETVERLMSAVSLLLDKPEITITPALATDSAADVVRPTVTLKANSAVIKADKEKATTERTESDSTMSQATQDITDIAIRGESVLQTEKESSSEKSNSSVPTAIVLITALLVALALIFLDIREKSKEDKTKKMRSEATSGAGRRH